MTVLSGPQQTANEQAVARTAYFAELQFTDGTSRLCTFDRSYNWGGFDWSGLGQVMDISSVVASEAAQANPLRITIAASAVNVALAVGAVTEYRGRPAKLYACPLDANYVLIGTPQLCWRGIMDTVVLGVQGSKGSVVINCETSAYALKRNPIFRINAAQHRARHPGETGFDYLNDLIANPQRWLSKKFMMR
jgi:hypothetical protein